MFPESQPMSIGSLGIIGSLAGTALPQRATETDKAARDTTDQSRAAQASAKAENAAGIGTTEEDSQTSERDADGRRLWELPAEKKPAQAAGDVIEPDFPHLSKDPTGQSGSALDLLG